VPEDQEFQPEAGVRPVAVDVRLAHPVARRLLGHPQVLGDLGQGFVAGPDQAHRLGTEGRRVVWLAYVVQGWVLGSEGFSASNTIPSLAGYLLVLAWTIWILIFAWRMKESPPAQPAA